MAERIVAKLMLCSVLGCGKRIARPTRRYDLIDRRKYLCKAHRRSRWRRFGRRRYIRAGATAGQQAAKAWRETPACVIRAQLDQCCAEAKRLPQDDRTWKYHPTAIRYRRLMRRRWMLPSAEVAKEGMYARRPFAMDLCTGLPLPFKPGPQCAPTIEAVWRKAVERANLPRDVGAVWSLSDHPLSEAEQFDARHVMLTEHGHTARLAKMAELVRDIYLDPDAPGMHTKEA